MAMAGQRVVAYRVRAADRRYLEAIARDGQMIQRVANRARALLALARGETSAAIERWTAVSRMGNRGPAAPCGESAPAPEPLLENGDRG